MVCQKCGYDNEEGAAFCVNCGEPLEKKVSPEEVVTENEKASEKPQKTEGKRKKWLIPVIIGAAAFLAVLIAVVGITIGAASENSKGGKKNDVYYLEDGDTVKIFQKGSLIGEYDAEYTTIYGVSKNAAYVWLEEEDTEYLYLLKNKKMKLVTDELLELIGFSKSGNKVAYINETEEMYVYDSKTGKSKMVTDDHVFRVTFTPNEKIMVYVVSEEDDDGETYFTQYSYDGKKIKELGLDDNFVPMSVTNKLNKMYGYVFDSEEDDCYPAMVKKGEITKFSKEDLTGCAFFKDGTQFVFETESGTYISDNYKDKVKIFSDELTFDSADKGEDFYKGIYMAQGEDGRTLIKPGKKGESVKIAKNVTRFEISDDKKTVAYKNESNGLYLCKVNKPADKKKIEGAVRSFVLSDDGKTLIYIDNESTLYKYNGGKSKLIAEDVYKFVLTDDGRVLYISDYSKNSGELYCCKGSGKPKHIMSDVYDIYNRGNEVLIAAEYDSESGFEVLRLTNTNKTKTIGNEIGRICFAYLL